MDEDVNNPIYSKQVFEFVAVTAEYCNFMNSLHTFSQQYFIQYSLRLLPLMYLKTSLLPTLSVEDPDLIEKFVSEEEWNKINIRVAQIMGDLNEYTESVGRFESNETNYIAESFADIYQDLQDFQQLYATNVDEMMSDAISEALRTFKAYWGQRLVNLLRILHYYMNNEKLNDKVVTDYDETNENWLSEQRKKEWGLENDIIK